MSTDIEVTENDSKAAALAAHLEEAVEADCYSSNLFTDESGREWLVLTDAEADAATRREILDYLWAFDTDFLKAHVISTAALEALDRVRHDLCERANPIVLALVRDIDDLVDDAIRADGRGHFLSLFNGAETELGWGDRLFAYRQN